MPTIYLNDGLRIVLNNREKGHKRPHVHAYYQDKSGSFTFTGEQLNGDKFPRKIIKEIQLYLVNHQEYLMELWRGDY